MPSPPAPPTRPGRLRLLVLLTIPGLIGLGLLASSSRLLEGAVPGPYRAERYRTHDFR